MRKLALKFCQLNLEVSLRNSTPIPGGWLLVAGKGKCKSTPSVYYDTNLSTVTRLVPHSFLEFSDIPCLPLDENQNPFVTSMIKAGYEDWEPTSPGACIIGVWRTSPPKGARVGLRNDASIGGLIVKVATKSLIVQETQAYLRASPVQGFSVPMLLGIYGVHSEPDLAAIVFSDGGSTLGTSRLERSRTSNADLRLRSALFFHLALLHSLGLQHGDLAGRNLLTGSTGQDHEGNGCIVDLGRAKIDHVCRGSGCEELQKGSDMLGIDLPKQTLIHEFVLKTAHDLH